MNVITQNENSINFLEKNYLKILTVKVSRENDSLSHFTVLYRMIMEPKHLIRILKRLHILLLIDVV